MFRFLNTAFALSFLAMSTALADPPSAGDLARWIRSGTREDLAKAIPVFRAAEDPVKNPAAANAVAAHFARYSIDEDLEFRYVLVQKRESLSKQDWLTLVRGWLRFAEVTEDRSVLIQSLVLLEHRTNSSFKYKKDLLQMIESEIRSGTILPSHLLSFTRTPGGRPTLSGSAEWTGYHGSPNQTPESISLEKFLIKDSEYVFRAALQALYSESPYSVRDYHLRSSLMALSHFTSPRHRKEATDALFESKALTRVLEYHLHHYDLTGRSHYSDYLGPILEPNRTGHFDAVDLLNLAIKREPHALRWIMPAFFLKQTSYPHNHDNQAGPGATRTQVPAYRQALERIDLSPVDPKNLEGTLLHLPFSEMLSALTTPSSPYFDRADLFAQYVRGDFYAATSLNRNHPVATVSIFLGEKGTRLPPNLAIWVGNSHLSPSSWNQLLERESLAPLEASPEGRKSLVTLFRDPLQLKRAMLSRDPALRHFAFEQASTRADLIPESQTLLEEVVHSLAANAIANGSEIDSRAKNIAEILKPLFGENSVWTNHPEFLEPGQKTVTPQEIVEHILSSKRSFITPAEPTAAPAHCLRQVLTQSR